MRKSNLLFTFALVITLCACDTEGIDSDGRPVYDSGDIEEHSVNIQSNGRTVKLTTTLTGTQALRDAGYSLALAGYENENNHAVMQRTIPASDGEQQVELVMSNITSGISTVELCVTNSLRRRYLSLHTIQMSMYEDATPTDTIYMRLGKMDVSLIGALQEGVFDKACIMCHGGNGRTAAQLDLTRGHTYASLVNQNSTTLPDFKRVKRGDADNSLLNIILNEGGENILRYNHTEVLSSQFKENVNEVRQLLRQWIGSLEENL